MKITTDYPQIEIAAKEITLRYGEGVFNGIDALHVAHADKTALTYQNGVAKVQARSLSEAYCALGRLLSEAKAGGQVCVEINKKMEKLGVMLDCARNAVANVEGLKKLIISLALMGYTYLELYVEDCFEVLDEPYFGYMRGRFTQAELKELNAYAKAFGIQLIPCIQTLAHLARIFQHWIVYTGEIQDKGDVLLVGEERTYTLIENMVKTCRECFDSDTINIGMDEAFELGKGKYFQKHGYVPAREIMRQHLARVSDICKKYNFKPSLWADMFYEDLEKGMTKDIPEEFTLIFWEYMCEDKTYYQKKFADLQRSGLSYSFAGGAHKWYGFTPLNAYSARILDLQYAEAQQGGVNNFMLTLWGDDGAECPYYAVLPTIAYLAEKNLENASGFADGLLKILTGYSYEEWLALDLPNRLYDGEKALLCNPAKYLFYVDPLLGIEELSFAPDYGVRYQAISQRLKTLANRRSQFSYLFKTAYRLSEYLEIKSTLTVDIDNAYKNGDKKALTGLANVKIPLAEKRLRAFISSFTAQWHTDSKPFGFEVEEFRLYGALGRLSSVRKKLKTYLDGKMDRIAELEEVKLSKPVSAMDEANGCKLYSGVSVTITYANV